MPQSLKHPDELLQENEKLHKENERLKALLHSQKDSNSLRWADSDKATPCKQEDAYRLFIENAPDGIVVVNEQGLYIEANAATEGITFGYKHIPGYPEFFVEDTGKGSTFFFSIPYSAIAKAAQTKKADIAKADNPDNLLILIAEDDELCEDYPEIALVLMDVRMPLMNGLEANEIIKKQRLELPASKQKLLDTMNMLLI